MMATLRTLFGEGFRVFFLSAGLYAVFSIAIWSGWLGVHAAGGMVTHTPFAPAPHLWHAHEMIFGYATAVLGGFFLTAAPSWTGSPPARTAYLTLVAGLWIAGRMAIWWSAHLSPWLVMAIDLAFLPALAAKILAQLLRRPKPQNLLLFGLLALIWTGNLLVHLEWTGVIEDGVWRGLRMGLLTLAALIAVIGGRVTPAFTRNAMIRAGRETALPSSKPPFDAVGIAAAISLPILYGFDAPEPAIAIAAGLAGLAQLLRLAGWRGLWTLGQPILWSLHLGGAMLAIGYLSLSAASFGALSEVAALHLLGIGAVGGMTLAVMSRATLGHSGRELVAAPTVAAAYLMVALAALLRAFASVGGLAWYYPATLASGALWCLAFTLFVAANWTALTTRRETPGVA